MSRENWNTGWGLLSISLLIMLPLSFFAYIDYRGDIMRGRMYRKCLLDGGSKIACSKMLSKKTQPIALPYDGIGDK